MTAWMPRSRKCCRIVREEEDFVAEYAVGPAPRAAGRTADAQLLEQRDRHRSLRAGLAGWTDRSSATPSPETSAAAAPATPKPAGPCACERGTAWTAHSPISTRAARRISAYRSTLDPNWPSSSNTNENTLRGGQNQTVTATLITTKFGPNRGDHPGPTSTCQKHTEQLKPRHQSKHHRSTARN